jgi:hypothetical protein
MHAPGEATGVQVRRLNRAGDGLAKSDEEPARRFHRLHRMSGRLDTAAHRAGALVHGLDRVVDRLCGAGIPWTRPSVEWGVPSGSWSSWPTDGRDREPSCPASSMP